MRPRAETILTRFADAAREARDALARAGVPRWELYAKASVWEETSLVPGRGSERVRCSETGLAVRTRRNGCSGFAAAAGAEPSAWRHAVDTALSVERADPVDPLPPPDVLGTGPAPTAPPPPPPGWAAATLAALEAAVRSLSGDRLRLVRGSVRSGEAGWLLHTAEGFTVSHRAPSTVVLAEVGGREPGRPTWRQLLPVREPGALDPAGLARRLVDPLLLLESARPLRAGVMDCLLDAAVAAHLLGGLVPLLLATPSAATSGLPEPGVRLGSSLFELVDDRPGRLGPLVAPTDGEGLPAARLELVERGVLRRRLACYRDALRTGTEPCGGAVRPSYREPPRTGIANLALLPRDGLSARRLLETAGRCLYLLRLSAPPEVDPAGDRYRLAGMGVTVDGGTVRAWHPLVEIRGRVSRLLHRLEGVGADLRWYQTAAGMVGSPPLLIRSQLVA